MLPDRRAAADDQEVGGDEEPQTEDHPDGDAPALFVDAQHHATKFLLLVPVTLGAVVYKGVGDVLLADLPAGMAGPFVVGSAAAFASALLAISALLGYVRRNTYSVFVWYRLAAAAFVLVLIAAGARSAGF